MGHNNPPNPKILSDYKFAYNFIGVFNTDREIRKNREIIEFLSKQKFKKFLNTS